MMGSTFFIFCVHVSFKIQDNYFSIWISEFEFYYTIYINVTTVLAVDAIVVGQIFMPPFILSALGTTVVEL